MGVLGVVEIDKIENGKIKLFNELEGWGFITDSNGKDVYFHTSRIEGIKKDPTEVKKVSFIRETGPKGPRVFKLYLYLFDKQEIIYRVLYKREDRDPHLIIFSTGTVDEIKYPKNFKTIRFQKKIGAEWLECSDPKFLKTESA